MKMLNKQLDELFKIEETMLRQQSRAVWMKGGDKNMKFFQGKANQRSKVNSIDKIKGEHGGVMEEKGRYRNNICFLFWRDFCFRWNREGRYNL